MEVDVTEKAKNFIRFGLLGLIVLAALAGGGLYLYQHNSRSFTVSDALVVGRESVITAKGDGKITELLVQDGDYVEEGAVIARVESKITPEDIAQLEQNVQLAQQSYAQLQKGTTVAQAAAPVVDSGAQQRASNAYSRMQRMNELFEMGAISAAKRDEAAAAYAAAQAAANAAPSAAAMQTTVVPTSPEVLKQAELQVKQAEAALANAKNDQQATEIRAAAAGVISLAEGIATGSELKNEQEVVRIQASNDAWLEAKLTANQAAKVRLGEFVNYEIDGHKLQGTVQDISTPENDESETDKSKILTVVKISLPADTSFTLKSGMTGKIEFKE
ncbi:MAG: HlyD family efflux transporter periplasmic adaptor subunit [Selenomonas sp.]|jgi:membrane fusion protein (multidrug efflux system)|uniref:HlyD family secretion protein n=1 Tax=Selenomonas sp. AE3005 TaxID=1485543 RepID=UPI0004889A4E|nr:HlyD family efflux transporter periplasmic adaptor subunit [Selenomonas sp. AE3005]MBQ1613740.1 HlyD family efflux transporter periplasmic adaptor subunit [Selenomonas sp.]MBQ4212005.1 HlyD family efflux transporter periplasmic adaptor subunit [Selenomonas sp.]MBQ5420211.1 HlyD family efflux transporter periplasmic adaptor subunit [Selenomonas sp.]MBQ5503259.1 HlyD family efflux transporter periplasmic adaptor subunit [Selenomonas sp.]